MFKGILSAFSLLCASAAIAEDILIPMECVADGSEHIWPSGRMDQLRRTSVE